MRWAGHVVHLKDMGNAYKIFAGKRPLGRAGVDGHILKTV
jgi:hypothetical protein